MGDPRATSKEEQIALIEGRGPLGSERLVNYNIFLTDAFGDRTSIEFWDSSAAPNEIDGFTNDDSYRRSRYLLKKATAAQLDSGGRGISNLRENSLARQLAEKQDQPATIRLIRRRKPEELANLNPKEMRVPWINLIPPNTKFFLEQVQENREEKVQVIDTFGEWVAFFFGRKPEVYSYAGTLLNAKNHDWKNEFQENYDHFLRGSQAVKNRATVILQYDDVLVEGYMLNSSISMAGTADKSVPFSFNMLVMNRSPMNARNMIGLRIQRSGRGLAEAQLFNTMQEMLDLTKTGRADELETFLLMREYFAGNYFPSAGKASRREKTNNMESETSTPPGAVGGTNNNKPEPAPVSTSTSDSVSTSGVSSPELPSS
jgi:hypothetical protein